MKKILNLLYIIIIISFATLATPHYPDGIPDIGPLKGGATFWGQDTDGGYFEGVSYGASYQIKISNSNNINININVNKAVSSTKGSYTEKSTYIYLKNPIQNFSGKIQLEYNNTSGKKITKTYQGDPHGKDVFIINTVFDLRDVKPNSNVTLILVLYNGRAIKAKINKKISGHLIEIANLFIKQ